MRKTMLKCKNIEIKSSSYNVSRVHYFTRKLKRYRTKCERGRIIHADACLFKREILRKFFKKRFIEGGKKKIYVLEYDSESNDDYDDDGDDHNDDDNDDDDDDDDAEGDDDDEGDEVDVESDDEDECDDYEEDEDEGDDYEEDEDEDDENDNDNDGKIENSHSNLILNKNCRLAIEYMAMDRTDKSDSKMLDEMQRERNKQVEIENLKMDVSDSESSELLKEFLINTSIGRERPAGGAETREDWNKKTLCDDCLSTLKSKNVYNAFEKISMVKDQNKNCFYEKHEEICYEIPNYLTNKNINYMTLNSNNLKVGHCHEHATPKYYPPISYPNYPKSTSKSTPKFGKDHKISEKNVKKHDPLSENQFGRLKDKKMSKSIHSSDKRNLFYNGKNERYGSTVMKFKDYCDDEVDGICKDKGIFPELREIENGKNVNESLYINEETEKEFMDASNYWHDEAMFTPSILKDTYDESEFEAGAENDEDGPYDCECDCDCTHSDEEITEKAPSSSYYEKRVAKRSISNHEKREKKNPISIPEKREAKNSIINHEKRDAKNSIPNLEKRDAKNSISIPEKREAKNSISIPQKRDSNTPKSRISAKSHEIDPPSLNVYREKRDSKSIKHDIVEECEECVEEAEEAQFNKYVRESQKKSPKQSTKLSSNDVKSKSTHDKHSKNVVRNRHKLYDPRKLDHLKKDILPKDKVMDFPKLINRKEIVSDGADTSTTKKNSESQSKGKLDYVKLLIVPSSGDESDDAGSIQSYEEYKSKSAYPGNVDMGHKFSNYPKETSPASAPLKSQKKFLKKQLEDNRYHHPFENPTNTKETIIGNRSPTKTPSIRKGSSSETSIFLNNDDLSKLRRILIKELNKNNHKGESIKANSRVAWIKKLLERFNSVEGSSFNNIVSSNPKTKPSSTKSLQPPEDNEEIHKFKRSLKAKPKSSLNLSKFESESDLENEYLIERNVFLKRRHDTVPSYGMYYGTSKLDQEKFERYGPNPTIVYDYHQRINTAQGASKKSHNEKRKELHPSEVYEDEEIISVERNH